MLYVARQHLQWLICQHTNTYLERDLLPLLHTCYIIDGFLLKEVETVIYQCFLSYCCPFPSIKPDVQFRKGTEEHTHTSGTFRVGNFMHFFLQNVVEHFNDHMWFSGHDLLWHFAVNVCWVSGAASCFTGEWSVSVSYSDLVTGQLGSDESQTTEA